MAWNSSRLVMSGMVSNGQTVNGHRPLPPFWLCTFRRIEEMKKTIRVTIEKELEIELMPSVLGEMTEAEYLESFCKDLWKVKSMDDVIKHAACVAATGGIGYQHDGIGLVEWAHFSTIPPDVKVREISTDIETEIIESA